MDPDFFYSFGTEISSFGQFLTHNVPIMTAEDNLFCEICLNC